MAIQSFHELLDDSLLQSGIDLESILGVREIAWGRADALRAIASLRQTDWAILGGDVLRRTGGKIEYTNDSWHTELQSNESGLDFLGRSHDEGEAFLLGYRNHADDPYLFVLVAGRVV